MLRRSGRRSASKPPSASASAPATPPSVATQSSVAALSSYTTADAFARLMVACSSDRLRSQLPQHNAPPSGSGNGTPTCLVFAAASSQAIDAFKAFRQAIDDDPVLND